MTGKCVYCGKPEDDGCQDDFICDSCFGLYREGYFAEIDTAKERKYIHEWLDDPSVDEATKNLWRELLKQFDVMEKHRRKFARARTPRPFQEPPHR